MDPLAHTLFGAALAETGLRRRSRYATCALVIGANLPDIDALAMLAGADVALFVRRGWTHGVLAIFVLPLLFTGTTWLWFRWRCSKLGEVSSPRFGWLLVLSFIAVCSHPSLDWMNTYGVRFLMPFDDRWFYGDVLFIIDPWFWLLTGTAVVLARSHDRWTLAAWFLLALLTTTMVVYSNLLPTAAKTLWLLGMAILIAGRALRPGQASIRWIARSSLLVLMAYTMLAYGFARRSEWTAVAHNSKPLQVQANPLPGVPYAHRVIAVYPSYYRVTPDVGRSFVVLRERPDALIKRALADHRIRGFVGWMRFPYWTVESMGGQWLVSISDLRYVNPDNPPGSFGSAQVIIDE